MGGIRAATFGGGEVDDGVPSRNEQYQLGRPFIVAGLVLLLGALVAALLAVVEPLGEIERSALSVSLATAAAATSLPAGLFLVNHYRYGGRRSDLDAGIIVLLTSALWLLPSRAFPVFVPHMRDVSPLLGAGIALTVVWLSRPQRAGGDQRGADSMWALLTRVRSVAIAATATVALLAILELVVPGISVARTMEPVNGALFGLGALFMLIRGYRTQQWSLTFIGMHLLGLEIGDAMAIAADDVTSGMWLGACFLSLVGASIGTFGALAVAKTAAESRERELLAASLYRIEALQVVSSNEERLHDLRSGLLSVEAFAGSLDRDPSVDLLVEEVARLREMVAASRQREIVDLDQELRRVVAARHALGVELDLDSEPDLRVLGPRSDLLEVVQNLVDNAVRHAPGSDVEVSARRAGDAIVLKVADRGAGFDESTLPLVFERGFTTNHQGTGLGLHIVRKLAGSLGGTVTAMNRRGGGALIEVRLPAADPRSAGDSAIDVRV